MKTAIGILLLFVSLPLFAQELSVEVSVNMEGIPSGQRDYLNNFKAEVEKYLNSTRFTDEDMLGDKITCTFDFFFKTVSGDNRYQVQLFVGSQRPVYKGNDKTDKGSPVVRILDDMVEFSYTPNQRMIHDDLTFDALTDLLDFYAYLIIGFDVETYTPMTGSRYFQKALNICQLASSTSYSTGWTASSAAYNRFGIVDELNNVKYNPFRGAFNSYHYDGIDLLATDMRTGLANMMKAVETISDLRKRLSPTSMLVKQFFNAKYKEIGDSFAAAGDFAALDKLSELDNEHRSYYQDKKSGR